MSWRDAFRAEAAVGQADDAAATPSQTTERRVLRVSDLLAIVRVLDHDGDGAIPVTSWEPDEDTKGRWHHVTRDVRVLRSEVVEIVRAAPETPWRTGIDVWATGDGWLAITDPLTGEQHEIRAADAPHAWTQRGAR